MAWKLIDELAVNDVKNIDFPKYLNCNNINNFFAELGAKTIQNFLTSPYFNYEVPFPSVPQTFVFDDISPNEIEKVALILSSSAFSGHDNLSEKLVKNIINYISLPLSKICNKSVYIEVVPLNFKIAKIFPIYKSGDITQLMNYRPISLLPMFVQLFEKLIYLRLKNFISKYNILSAC